MTNNYFRRFRDAEDGTAAVELVLVVPILVWALLSTVVYFDLFKAKSMSVRAGLTIADMFSREQRIDNSFINGAQSLLSVLALPDGTPDLRVTYYRYDDDDKKYYVVWSKTRGTAFPAHTNATLDLVSDRLPILADRDRTFLVETKTAYSAPFSIGIGPFVQTNFEDIDFDTFTFIRPRFSQRICFEEDNGSEVCD